MINTVEEMKEHFSGLRSPDGFNVVICTSAGAITPDNEETTSVEDAESFQCEGYILHPRKRYAEVFEIVTTDPTEFDYLRKVISESAIPLAQLQSFGYMLTRPHGKLGENVKKW